MSVIIIGLGSMGKRRLKLIKKYDKNINIIGVDLKENRRNECEKKFNIITFSSLDKALKKNIKSAFVCTSPITHSSIIEKCIKAGVNVFTEINLISDGYNKNMLLAKENNVILYISSTLLFRKEILKINELIDNSKKRGNYLYHVGQYLPDWHPWENYRDFFVSNKKTNGCREILAIELPWLVKVFGKIIDFNVMKDKISNLDVDYYDNYIISFKHKSGYKGSLMVDIVSRKAVRNFEIFSEDLYLSWDGSPNGLKEYDYINNEEIYYDLYQNVEKDSEYNNSIIENAYYREIEDFFNVMLEGKINSYTFKDDLEIIELIDKIER